MSRKERVAVWSTLVMLVALSATALLVPIPTLVHQLQQIIQDSGPFGPLLFVTAVILTVIIPPIPNRPLMFSAGALFEPFWGCLLVIGALSVGAVINFLAARLFGERWLRGKPEYAKYLREVKLLGTWQSIVLLRLFAGFTFDWYSYLAGLLKTRFRTYVLATVAGTAPRVALDVYAGNFLGSRPWLTIVIGTAVATASLILLSRHSKLRHLAQAWKKWANS